jgi:hypothetical protein
MSRLNKANKSNYIQAGRLTPDEIARERQKQLLIKDPDLPAATRRRQGANARSRAAARKTNRTAG